MYVRTYVDESTRKQIKRKIQTQETENTKIENNELCYRYIRGVS